LTFPFLPFLDTLPNPFAGKLLPTASAACIPEFLGTRLARWKKSAAGSFAFLSEKREIEKYLQGTKEQPCRGLSFHVLRRAVLY
jgi:hypothetical protein